MPINIMIPCAVGGRGTHWTPFGYGPDSQPLDCRAATREQVVHTRAQRF